MQTEAGESSQSEEEAESLLVSEILRGREEQLLQKLPVATVGGRSGPRATEGRKLTMMPDMEDK